MVESVVFMPPSRFISPFFSFEYSMMPARVPSSLPKILLEDFYGPQSSLVAFEQAAVAFQIRMYSKILKRQAEGQAWAQRGIRGCASTDQENPKSSFRNRCPLPIRTLLRVVELFPTKFFSQKIKRARFLGNQT